mmetsp:Transcript_2549/g.3717  ORF Transcript_2549/g.3717 Transcript_2549/m.3717 type:complete len:305 (-) Transcript_2549:353-1267(-)
MISRLVHILVFLACAITSTSAQHTALLFGANGAVGSEILRAIVSDPDNNVWNKVILVGRRFPPKVTDLPLPSGQTTKTPQVVRIQLSDLSNVDENKELLDMKADACFIAVGSGSPQEMALNEWHSVEVGLVASMTRLCNQIQVQTVTLLSAIDTEDEPIPFAQDELNDAADDITKPLGWWRMVQKYGRMMGLKELAVKRESANIPRVCIFRPSTIVTTENRYGWVDWTIFKLHKVFDPIIPAKYHSVEVGLLGEAMVKEAAAVILSSCSRQGDCIAPQEKQYTYEDFLHIIAKKAEEAGTGISF